MQLIEEIEAGGFEESMSRGERIASWNRRPLGKTFKVPVHIDVFASQSFVIELLLVFFDREIH